MKIAMIGQKLVPSRKGGVEIVVTELSKRMSNLGYEVDIYNRLSSKIDDNASLDFYQNEYTNVHIKWAGTKKIIKLSAVIYSFCATVKACFSKCDVIHFHAEGPSIMIPIAKLFRKRCIATVHGLDWKRSKWQTLASSFIKQGEKEIVKGADEIIVVSRELQYYFQETYGISTTYIPNATNPPTFRKPKLIHEFGLYGNDYVLCVGRLVPEKGIHHLVEAYKKLNTDKKLVITGSVNHPSEQKYEKSLLDLANNDTNIIFTGFVEGELLEELYSNAYLFCLPSELEGMPITMLEAASYNNCLLLSDLKVCKDTFKQYCEFFKSNDITDLAKKLNYLLSNPSEVDAYKESIKNAQATKITWDTVCEQTINVYKKALKNEN